ncbi:MSHA biogenesis protein MshP [Vibrio sp. SM6]|uniref:MSHA biogenesis protein MshP n=1 Tax=Vibrio agarilyticus TaxID=2726741 RepID=A0A7X8YII2_9VIBR|nr:MSHA biogenesis protein MshP [Vibrio agarilyticus]NLS14606.1 MSHA biogenesis protein MshP [Vibrio agarilyticus]
MCLNRKQSQGNVLIVAIFILVVVGFLATTLTNIRWSHHDSLTREQLGAQALMAAESTQQWALTQLYPLNQVADVVSSCAALNSAAVPNLTINTPCQRSTLTCQAVGELESQTFYRLTATAECGSGAFSVSRSQQVWVKE